MNIKNITMITMLSGLLFLFQTQIMNDFMIWDIEKINSGEWWRLITGNYTHTNMYHLIMNVAAIWIVTFLFDLKIKEFIILTLCASITVGLSMLLTDYKTYAGFSGILHSLIAFVFLKSYIKNKTNFNLFCLFALILKLFYDYITIKTSLNASLIEADVAVVSHVAGVITGFIISFIMLKIEKNVAI